MTTRTATCNCGQLTVTCEGEPVRVGVCHCLACQVRTGSAFSVHARFHQDHVTIRGESTSWVRIGDEGSELTMHFCPTCGATVWWIGSWEPELVAVAVGAFADPTFPGPTYEVYEERRHPWLSLTLRD